MLENLGTAIKRQRRLIVIFLLTIFLPGLSLSVFGIRALRNEKYRLARQAETEARRAVQFVRAQFEARFDEIANTLKGLAQHPGFQRGRRAEAVGLIQRQLVSNRWAELPFLFNRDDGFFFPLLQILPDHGRKSTASPPDSVTKAKLDRAEALELRDRDYGQALTLYADLIARERDASLRGQMLLRQGRCLEKAGNFPRAIAAYARVGAECETATGSSGLPLACTARLRIVDCYRRTGNSKAALEYALTGFGELLRKPMVSNRDQFAAYSSLIAEEIDRLLGLTQNALPAGEGAAELGRLKNLHAERTREWETSTLLVAGAMPELPGALYSSSSPPGSAVRFSKTINGLDFLVIMATIPGGEAGADPEFLGVKVRNEYFWNDVLGKAANDAGIDDNVRIAISSLPGRLLAGQKPPSGSSPLVTEFFPDNFPPWKIELSGAALGGLEVIDIRKSFYFWTILAFVVVLVFGAFLMVRTMAHEVEIVKIKSDFVSSVSHEFKTPLTSIKALVERLSAGKVHDPEKMAEYFAIIARDTDKLTRLVKNLLDFSKVEEGRAEYTFEPTDLAQLAAEQVKNFGGGGLGKDIAVRLETTGDIPLLRLDRDAVSQALGNLLDNAAKFSPPGTEVRVILRRQGDRVVIEVRDKGIGIPPDEIGKIFDKFYQARNALRLSIGGTGLGLPLVKHIVEAHGGEVRAESEEGRGSAFFLIFPITEKGG